MARPGPFIPELLLKNKQDTTRALIGSKTFTIALWKQKIASCFYSIKTTENVFPVFPLSYGNTRESLGELEIAVEKTSLVLP